MSYQVPPSLFSWDDAQRLYPDTRFEIYDGVIYAREAAPFTPHQRAVGQLHYLLKRYTEEHPTVGEAFVSPYDVLFRAEAPAVVMQPDVLFVLAARAGQVGDYLHGPPDIVVEVVSPSSARRDSIYKRNRYAHFGVAEYWIVWPDEQQVDVLRLEGHLYGDGESLGVGDTLTSVLLPGFSMPINRLFPPPYGS